ncbi:MAG: endonuclease/exonuclease/phosphatase family protein [Hyphomicrobiaceae bacterium]
MTSTSDHAFGAGRLLAGLTLAGALGGIAAGFCGGWWAPFDILAELRGHLIGAALGAMLALRWRGREIVTLGLAAVATLGVHAGLARLAERGAIAAAYASAAPEVAGGAVPSLRVVSLNTWHSNPDHARLARFIRESGADVVLLYEFGPDKQHLIGELADLYPHSTGCAERWSCAVEILSRRPILSSEAIRSETSYAPSTVIARIEAGGRQVSVVGTHLTRPIDGPGRRMTEIETLAELVRHEAGEVIVAGDFNMTPWSRAFALFAERSGLTHMGRFMPSWPSGTRGLPHLAIDHVWATPGIRFAARSPSASMSAPTTARRWRRWSWGRGEGRSAPEARAPTSKVLPSLSPLRGKREEKPSRPMRWHTAACAVGNAVACQGVEMFRC